MSIWFSGMSPALAKSSSAVVLRRRREDARVLPAVD